MIWGQDQELQLAEDLSTLESLEISLRFTARPPAVQTMGNLSLYYILPDLEVSGGVLFSFKDVPGYLVWGKLLSFCCFVQPLETSPCCEGLERSLGRKSLSLAWSPAFNTSALSSFSAQILSSIASYVLWAWNGSEGFLHSHPEHWWYAQTHSVAEVPWGSKSSRQLTLPL